LELSPETLKELDGIAAAVASNATHA